MRLCDALERILLEKQLENLSLNTIADYRAFMGRMVKFYNPDQHVEELQQSDIEQYLLATVTAPLSKSTKATYIRHAKIFLKWIYLNYEVSFNYARIKVPKSSGKHVRIYNDADIKAIFSAVNYSYGRTWMIHRDKAIISLMLDCGLRQNEVCSIMKTDFYNDFQRLVVHGKGDKYRVVPVGSATKKFVQRYLDWCPFKKTEHLFCDKSGEKVSRNTVKMLIRKLDQELPFEISSHKLRHNFATNWCIDQHEKHGSVDLVQLMYIMGHNDVKTTQRYLHLASEIIAGNATISHLDKVYSGED